MAVSTPSDAVASFGVFEVNLRSGELRKCGIKIKIQDLPFQALKLFLTHPTEVLSREDIRHALWPDGVYVDFDRGVISTINRLRDTLGDSAETPVFIETVGRRGYRWIAPVQVPQLDSPLPEDEPPAQNHKTEGASKLAILLRWEYLSLGVAIGLIVAIAIFTGHSASDPPVKSSPSTGSHLTNLSPAANRDAQEFYLQGRYYWQKRTPESLNKALDSFTQAIVRDPSYAPAYVGLADCYNLLREYTVMPASEAYPRALAAAKKAVELDPRSSEAHASLAFTSFYGMWDVDAADREFQQAITLSPGNATAHHWYATFLSCLRRYPQALGEIERAQALDPSSRSVLADKGSLLFAAGRDKEALVLLKQIEESDPDFVSPHRYLRAIYLLTGQYPQYLDEAKKEATLMHDESSLAVVQAIDKAFHAGGRNGLFDALIMNQKTSGGRRLVSPLILAQTYSLTGNKQQALRYLKICYDRRVDGIEQIESDHFFDNLHDDSSFRKLLGDIGLPPLN